MHWPKFVAWNAAGGIAWAISVGVFAYFVGEAAVAVIHTAGYVALGAVTVALVAVAAWALFRRR
jgi:membrane protein DedA with SNARE-associated domain